MALISHSEIINFTLRY